MRLPLSIRSKLSLILVLTTLFVTIICLGITSWLLADFWDREVVRELHRAEQAAQMILRLRQEAAQSEAEVLALRLDVMRAIMKSNRKRLLQITRRFMQERGLDYIVVTDAAGTVLARAHAPQQYGDNLRTRTAFAQSLQGQKVMTILNLPSRPLLLAGGAPVLERVPPYRLLGAIVTGYALDNTFVEGLKATIGEEVSIIIAGRRRYTTLPAIDTVAVIPGEKTPYSTTVDRQRYRAVYSPLPGSTATGRQAGYLEIARPEKVIATIFSRLVTTIEVGVGAAGILILGLALWLGSRFTRGLAELTLAAQAFGGGNFAQRVAIRSGDEVETLGNTFNQMAERIQQAQRKLLTHAERLQVQREIDRAILAIRPPEEIARTALHLIRQLVPYRRASVVQFDFRAQEVRWLAVVLPEGETRLPAGMRLPMQEYGVEEDLRQGEVKLVPDIQTLASPPLVDQVLLAEGIRSYVTVPLVVQGELIGSLNLGAEESQAFTEEQVDILRKIADSLAIAIEQSRLSGENEQRLQELMAVHQAGQHLQQLYTPERLSQEIIRVLEDTLGYEYGAVLLIEEGSDRLLPFALSEQGKGPDFVEADKAYVASHPLRVGVGITGWVAQSGKSVRVGDVRKDPRYYAMREEIRSELCVPLRLGDRVIGVVNVETPRLNAYTETDQRVLETVASQIAVAIQNARLYEQVQRHAAEMEQQVIERTRALAASELRYRQLVESPLVGIWQADAGGRFVFINQRLAEMSGYAPEEVIGKMNMLDPIAPEQRPWLMERMQQRRRGELLPDIVEAEMVRKDGSRFTALVAPAGLYDDKGNFTGFIGAMIDISPRKELEQRLQDRVAEVEQLNRTLTTLLADLQTTNRDLETMTTQLREANEELEAFAYSVSHDLRAPLRAMQGFAQALLEDYAGHLDPVGQDYAQRIVKAAQRMDALIQDLLAYSRLSRTQVTPQPIPLSAAVSEVLRYLEEECQQREARVTVTEPLPLVQGYQPILIQVLSNLLSNALKYVPTGKRPFIRIRAEERDTWIRLWVEDNGIGIAPEHQARIFRIFERLHDAETYPGTGIGLAIVRKGIERLGGRVGVESVPDEGSRFWIELPKGS